MFSARQKVACVLWLAQLYPIPPVFSASLIRCTWRKQHQFINLWCAGTSIWKRKCIVRAWAAMPYGVPGQYQMNIQSISEEPSWVCSRSKFTIRLIMLNCLWCFVQRSGTACLQASGGPKGNMQRSWFKKTVSFTNAILHWREWNLPQQTVIFWQSNTYCVWDSQQAQLLSMRKWKLWCYWIAAWFTEGQCVVQFDEK